MSGTVTVPGSNGSQITYTFPQGGGLTVAQQIANALAAAGSNLVITAPTVTGGVIPAPSNPNVVNELILTGPGPYTVPAGYIIVDNSTTPITISGGAGDEILAGTVGGSFNMTGNATIAAAGGSNSISATGGTSKVIQVAGGTSTITSSDSGGTIQTNTGSTDIINVSGSNDPVLSGGTDTISSSGTGNLIVGTSTGTGSMFVTETGTNDTILGGGNPMTVTATTATRVYAGCRQPHVCWWSRNRDCPGWYRCGLGDRWGRRGCVRGQYRHERDGE